MLKKFLILAVFIFSAQFALAQSQSEMNQEAYNQYRQSDKELNDIYAQILRDHKNDPLFTEKLKQAQRAWIAYRDAMVDLQYPANSPMEKLTLYGSFHPVCDASLREKITVEQTKVLLQWIIGIPEGEMCNGSIPIKP